MEAAKPARRLLASAVLVALATLTTAPVLAQDGAQTPASAAPAENERTTTLSGLTVTAQKREEQLQDVPIVITALDAQLLQDNGIRDIKDLQNLVPGLTVTSTQNEAITTARIRGIGTVGDNVGLESSVGIVIDGVYRSRNSVGFGDLGELERIEVLKGPQGTVFGKNTSAGVINVVTRRPSYTQAAEGELTVGNYGARGVSGYYNDALGETAAFNVYAAKRERDGWMDVVTGNGPRTKTDDYDQNYHLFRGQLLFEPTDNLDINFIVDYTSREENCCSAVQTVVGGTAPIIDALGGGNAIAIPADPFARVAYSNRDTSQDIKDKGISAQVNWDSPWFGEATLTSITAYREWQAINGLDLDFTSADMLYRSPNEDESFSGFETFSQELRLTGATESVDWMVGMFYSDEDLNRNDSYRVGAAYEPYLSTLVGSQVLGGVAAGLAGTGLTVNAARPDLFLSEVAGLPAGTPLFAGLGALDRYKQNAKSLALFTNNTWHATDALDLTLGLRYTHERKELDSAYSNPNGSFGCGSTLANPNAGARVGAAIAGRINGFATLPPATQAAILAGILPTAAPQVAGFMCLPWANALHNGRITEQKLDEKEWSGTLKGAYRWNENIMTYASAARGYKGGGFNLDRVQSSNGLSSGGAGITPVNDTSFPGEFVDSYELGAKTTWAGGNLLLNGTVFHQTYEDFQLNSFLGTSFVVRSIPKVVSRGIDTEVMWQPANIRGLMFQGGLMYADTEYGSHIPGADFAAGGQLYKLPGSQASFAPKWSGTAAVTYEWGFGADYIGRFNLSGKYMSDYNTGSDLDAEKAQSAFAVFNARLGFGASDKRWMVELWGVNIFDKDYVQVGFDGPLQAVGSPQPGDPMNTYNAFLGAPAMYGVTFRLRY